MTPTTFPNHPLVSIGVPVYNEERFLDASLTSLRQQDYPNLEILIADNASTDRTLEICERHAAEDARIRVVRSAENRGAIANFQRALDLAQGPYLGEKGSAKRGQRTYPFESEISYGSMRAVSRMMQAIGRRYVRAFNAKYARTGTLWEGRFRSCLVDSERYLLTCLRYIELNPVRAGLVALPWDYRWSSVHAHLGLRPCPLSRPHPVYAALGADAVTRAARYRELLLEPLDDEHLSAVRAHMRQERALGSPRFQAMVEKTLRRPVGVRQAGRPVPPPDSNGYVL